MITPRLEMILRHVTGKSCADIGTDHAYIPIELSKRGMRVIASDIMPGPLEIAKENVNKNEASVELRLGGGLEPIKKGEVDTVIIAGMGGEMIEKILRDAPDKTEGVTFILQPMNRQAELRQYLLTCGFIIISEDLALEGFKVYNLIVARKPLKNEAGIVYNNELERHIPPVLKNHPHYPSLVAKKKREFGKIMEGLQMSKDPNKAEIARLGSLLEDIEKIERSLLL